MATGNLCKSVGNRILFEIFVGITSSLRDFEHFEIRKTPFANGLRS